MNQKLIFKILRCSTSTLTLRHVPLSSLKEVQLMRVWTLMSPTPFNRSLRSSAVRPSRELLGITSNTPSLMCCNKCKVKSGTSSLCAVINVKQSQTHPAYVLLCCKKYNVQSNMHSFMCCYKNKVQLKAEENNNRESKQTTF